MIKRFIAWYLLKHNAGIECQGYVIRMFSKGWYEQNITFRAQQNKKDYWIGKINGLLETLEEICQDIRERSVSDYVCGLCEYDADHGLDGHANECPGFERNDYFRLKESFKRDYLESDPEDERGIG